MARFRQNVSKQQIGRVCSTGDVEDPATQSGANDNLAKEILVDEYGRPWVRVQSMPANAPQVYTTGFYQTTALASSGDIKTTPGSLIQVWGINTDTANVLYFQLFDETGPPPANGTVPLVTIPVQPNGGMFSLAINQSDAGQAGVVPFDTNGIEWAASSTLATLTLAGALFWVNAIYI